MKRKKMSREDIRVCIHRMFLDDWSGLESPYLAPPRNTEHIFHTYSNATGCSLEEAKKRAARALLNEWREEHEG